MRRNRQKRWRAGIWAVARQALLLAGALLMTLAYFLILPLMGALGKGPETLLELRSLDVVEQPPPPPETEPEEPPEEDVEPKLETELKPLDLSDLEMALNAVDGSDAGAGFSIDLGKYMKGASQSDAIFSMADLDQKPQAVYQPAPAYPSELQRQRLGGTVTVLFIVNAGGHVEGLKVLNSPHPLLEREALAAIRKWRFDPGRRGGVPVAFRMQVPITFSPN